MINDNTGQYICENWGSLGIMGPTYEGRWLENGLFCKSSHELSVSLVYILSML